MLLKTVKGTRDVSGEDMAIRNHVFKACKKVFRLRNVSEFDTPVMELKAVLTAKYGEEEKLIFDLADQGGEKASLRYDLTVPFSRHVLEKGLKTFRRYQIGKVYRRDQPNPATHRYREFTQIDYDILHDGGRLLPEFEVLEALCACLDAVGLADYAVHVNDRRLLSRMFDSLGISTELHNRVSTATDKLDKATWGEVSVHLRELGLSDTQVDRLNDLIQTRGPFSAILDRFPPGEVRDRYAALVGLLATAGILDRHVFDASLARGLDYYRGLIFEVKLPNGTSSVAAGGTYDATIAAPDSNNATNRLATGLSIGVERLCGNLAGGVTADPDFHVALCVLEGARLPDAGNESPVPGLIERAVAIASDMRNRQVKVSIKMGASLRRLLAEASGASVDYAVIIGQKELQDGTVIWKDMKPGGQQHEVTLNVLKAIFDTNPQSKTLQD